MSQGDVFPPNPFVKGGHIASSGGFTLPQPLTGAWVAYNYGSDRFVVFATEVEALRYALGLHMQVRFQKWGEEQ